MARNRLYPPSVDPGLPVEPKLPAGWIKTTFRDVLRSVERAVQLEDDRLYTLVIAKRNRGGIVRRGELRGRDILTKTQFEVHAGDFLISRRQIIHGACAVVPADLHGAIVSNEYASIRTAPTLQMDYLRHLSHTPYFQRTCFHSSHGVDIEKMVFKLDRWLAWPVHIPPPREQHKLAATLSSVDDTIEKTQAVIGQLQVVKKAMMQELLTRGIPGRHTRFMQTDFGELPQGWDAVRLGDLLEGIDAGWSPQCGASPPGPSEWGVLKVSAITSGEFLPTESKALPQGLRPRPEIEVRPGDLILARANGVLDLVGRTVFVRQTPEHLMLSDKLLRLRPQPNVMTAEFLHYCFSDDRVREQLLGTTGGSHMRNISQAALRQVIVPFPPGEEQQCISNVLSHLDQRRRVEERFITVLVDVKSALISVLLTGEVRVTPDPEPTP